MIKPGIYRFDDFYWERMYGEHGYYRNGNGVGKDFDTYVKTDQCFAPRIAKWLDEKWEQLGTPHPYPVYEIAAGDGSLYKKLMSLNLKCKRSIRYTAIEWNTLYHRSFPYPVKVFKDFEVPPLSGVIFANELLDTQPVRSVSYRENGWRELFVRVNDVATYEWRELNELLPATLQATKGMNGSAPWIQKSADLLRNITRNFTGHVLMIDYGFRRTVDLVDKPWLKCWLNFEQVSELDLTILPDMSTFVPIDQLIELYYPATVTEYTTWVGSHVSIHDGYYVMEWDLENGILKS